MTKIVEEDYSGWVHIIMALSSTTSIFILQNNKLLAIDYLLLVLARSSAVVPVHILSSYFHYRGIILFWAEIAPSGD